MGPRTWFLINNVSKTHKKVPTQPLWEEKKSCDGVIFRPFSCLLVVVLDEKKKITSTIGHLKRHIMVSLSIFFGPFFGFKTVWEDEDVEGRKRNNTGVFF